MTLIRSAVLQAPLPVCRAIPSDWLTALAQKEKINMLIEQFYAYLENGAGRVQ